jgi:demethylspheroidene O-methyltransferase
MVEHHALLYADLRDPVALLRADQRDTHLAQYWAYARSPDPGALPSAQVESYSALMAISQPMVAEAVLAAYPLHRHRCLMDVGGGSGAFLQAAGRRNPHLNLILFDLPPVAALAQGHLARCGLSARSRTVGGDFLKDRLPSGADVIALIRVLHDHDDAAALQILAAVHAALPQGGTLLIGEPMSGTGGAEPVADAYFGLYLWAMGSGRARTPAALAALLQRAGFNRPRARPTAIPLLTRVLVTARRT